MDYIKSLLSNNTHEQLGVKLGNTYKLGKKILDQGIRLGHKVLPVAEKFIANPYVQTAVSLLPGGGMIGQGLQKGVALGKKVLSGAEKVQSMLNRGETLYNQFKSHSAQNSNVKLVPRNEKELRSNSAIERGGEKINESKNPVNPAVEFAQHMEGRK